ncbi:MAG: hypothetical protein Q8P20_00150 [bacterium]|nr:hypothetical protein [bacterium]
MNPLNKYIKKDHKGGFPSLELYHGAFTDCHSYEPMAKLMRDYFEFGLGDLINELIEHKNRPFYKKWTRYHKVTEAIIIRMINVMIQWQQKDRFDGF